MKAFFDNLLLKIADWLIAYYSYIVAFLEGFPIFIWLYLGKAGFMVSIAVWLAFYYITHRLIRIESLLSNGSINFKHSGTSIGNRSQGKGVIGFKRGD